MPNDEDDGPSVDAKGQLTRKSLPGGGEVLTGGLAARALTAVGARAMTMDSSIFVDESFDPNNTDDHALYAHERYHQLHSGGDHEHAGGHDAEEQAARDVERMVLHRRARGDDFGAIMRDIEAGDIEDPSARDDAPGNPKGDDDPMKAYRMLRQKGMGHEGIVRMLAKHVVQNIIESEEERKTRQPSTTRLV